MAGRKKKLHPEEVTEALRQAHGLKTGAAEILGVHFTTIERYIAESEEARGVIEHYRIRRKDRAEYKLDEAIERGESWSIMFTLKNAKDREYSDKVDITSGGERIEPIDNERFARAFATLADALRESVSGKRSGEKSKVDTAK